MITVPSPFTLSVVCMTTDAMPSDGPDIAGHLRLKEHPIGRMGSRWRL